MPFQISSILIQASIDHTEFAKVASSTLTSQVFYSPFSPNCKSYDGFKTQNLTDD